LLPQLRTYLLQNWSKLPLEGPRPYDLTFLVQATGVSKLCCYVFADEMSKPQWVAKMARSPRDNEVLAREYDLVQHLRRHGSAFVQATIPGPLLTTCVAGHFVGIEPYLPGQPMDGFLPNMVSQAKSELYPYLDLAIGWLLRSYQEAPIQHGQLADRQIHTHFLCPMLRFQHMARLTPGELRYLECQAKQVTALSQHPLPLVFNHGDFRPGNILLDGHSIQVIDWEFGASTALPLLDVFFFLSRLHARVYYDGLEDIDGHLEDYLTAFEAVFFEEGIFADLTAEYVERACQALDMNPAWVSVLLTMFLINEANRYYAFLNHRADRGYVYLLRSRTRQIDGGSYLDQLARQKNVWLLGHLAQNEERLIFRHRR
jgi:Ser/Thr protein kinase RdoA (MazF antagonist)